MSTTFNTTAKNNFNTTGLSDETFRKMVDAGHTVETIERFWAQLEYRKEYNARPEVREKRREYNRKRADKMKELRRLM